MMHSLEEKQICYAPPAADLQTQFQSVLMTLPGASDSASASRLTDAACCIADDGAFTSLNEGVDMTRLSLEINHMPPMHEPPPDVLPLPVDPDKGPVPDLLPDDPSRDGVTQPVA